MADFTDYYELLKLDRNSSAAEIDAKLIKLEKTWKKNQLSDPVTISEMLGLISDARKVFRDEQSKAQYDRELEDSKREPDPEGERRDGLNKWKEQARSYYSSKQYDLAKVAIDRSLALTDDNEDDFDLLNLAASIYLQNGDPEKALGFINRAIVSRPDNPYLYFTKGMIINELAVQMSKTDSRPRSTIGIILSSNQSSNVESLIRESRKMYMLSVEKAAQYDLNELMAHAYGALAYSFYYQPPFDKQKGEEYANLAEELGGDDNAKEVLNDINAQREAETKRLEEERAREELKRIRAEKERQRKLEQQRREKAEEKKKQMTVFILFLIFALGIMIYLAIKNFDRAPSTSAYTESSSSEQNYSDNNSENTESSLPSEKPDRFYYYNGHTYGIYDAEEYGLRSYNDCADFCRQQGGHLAVINNGDENSYLYNIISEDYKITAFFGYSDEEEEGEWKWSDGDSDYENWTRFGDWDLPDNGEEWGGDEDYAEFNYDAEEDWIPNDTTWNDAPFMENTTLFICEWDYEVN